MCVVHTFTSTDDKNTNFEQEIIIDFWDFDMSAKLPRRKTLMSIDKIHIGMYFAHISLGFVKNNILED